MFLATAVAICSVTIPPLHALPGGGVETGHVTVKCPKSWSYSVNQIEYKDRWRIMGTERHPGASPGVRVVESLDSEPGYHGSGYWREVVVVHGWSGWTERHIGPVTWIAA